MNLYKVKIAEEYTYLIEASSPKEATLEAEIHRQHNTVGDHGGWRVLLKKSTRKLPK